MKVTIPSNNPRVEITAELTDYFSLQHTEYKGAKGRREQDWVCCGPCPVEHLPKAYKHLAKWHLMSRPAPTHYIANAVYWAGERDCWGLLKGETVPLTGPKGDTWTYHVFNPETFKVETVTVPAGEPAPEQYTYSKLWVKVGDGKERDLDAARSCAKWPDATDEDLTAPGLKDRLEARLPALMASFWADMYSFFGQQLIDAPELVPEEYRKC